MNREAANTIKGRLATIEESMNNVSTSVLCMKNFAEILEPDQARQMFLKMEHDLIQAWETVNDQLNEPAPEYHGTYNLNTEEEPGVLIVMTESGMDFMRDRDPIEIPPLPMDNDDPLVREDATMYFPEG